MKGLLLRLLGAYAGLGALSFALHRLRYLGTSQVRAWTDHRARRVEAELDELRAQLADLRHQVKGESEAPGELDTAGAAPGARPLRVVRESDSDETEAASAGNQNRRFEAEAPASSDAGDRQRLAA
jgi:hypothetical protein